MSKFITNDEAAQYIGVAPSTMRKWVYERFVPFRKHGRKVLFCKDDLDRWSEEKRVAAIPDDEHDELLSSLKNEYQREFE